MLPEHIAAREDHRLRFEREARAVASLNHPNICSLHDIGPGYMVMELVDGETLSARLAKGALPLDQALKYATQIADALDRAHRAGVTHRDVKPGNIMLTRDGAKVLDFGLAKSASKKPAATDATLTMALTGEGTVLGTPQYMAPELFEGKEADARADIWAFGAVLYEMVTGRKAFEGKSYTSLVGAILSAEPAPMAIAPFTPAWLERLTRRCLAKDPEERYQSMRDIVLDLRTPPAETAVAKPASRWLWAVAAATLVIGALGGWAMSRSAKNTAPDQAYRLQLDPPEGGQFDHSAGFALSPDGRLLAFVATAAGKSGLWVRPLDGTAARLLPGTERARLPFWSPDGRSLAYHASGQLWRVEVAGGSPLALCETPAVSGGDWSANGFIVFATGRFGHHRVPVTGGASSLVTAIDTGRGEIAYFRPQILPGGRILFVVTGTAEVAGIYASSLANPRDRVRLVAGSSYGVYAAGHLVWRRGSTLVAQPFDLEQLKLSGEPRPIADPVSASSVGGIAAASSSGLLVHGRANSEQLSWVDRAGQASHPTPIPADGRLGQPDSYLTFRVSPDGRRVTVGRGSSNGRDVWTVETERDAWSRLTFLPGFALNPVWSPDGRQVIFSGRTPMNLYRKEASGAGTEQRITESANEQVPTDWSRDGRLVLYFEIAPGTQRDLWVLPVTPDGQLAAGASANAGARPYLRTRFNEYHGRFSPEQNPRWVAYHVGRVRPGRGLRAGVSGASGQVPDLDRRRRLPRVEPRRAGVVLSFGGWQADDGGRDHRRGFGGAVPTSRVVRSPGSGGRLRLPLFRCADGKRFLVLTPAGGSQPLEVIVNWPALLKKGVAGE